MMGTRADFYDGRGLDAEWLGSIAWDGYPGGIPRDLLEATDAALFRNQVTIFLASREDATLPERGWPWPWEDSGTTDYAYALDEGKVWGSCFGYEWFDATQPEPEDRGSKVAVFPNMKDRQNVRWDKGSGVIILGGA